MSKTPFAERLQRLMIERGLSQSDLARLIWGTMNDERGYEVAKNRQVLGKYLAGTVEPRMGTKRKMAEVLKVPLAEIAPESDPANRPGSGILIEPVDGKTSHLRVDLKLPRTVVQDVVGILLPYAQ